VVVGHILLQLAEDSLFSVRSAALLILICVIAEYASPRGRRIALRARFPGAFFSLMLPAFSIILSVPLQAAYRALGVGTLVIVPLADWMSPLGGLGTVFSVVILVLLGDFLEYWRHRAEHAFIWPIHAVHHSPTDLHAANGFGHPLQVVTSFVFITIPMSLIQMQGASIPALVGLVITFMLFFIHAATDVHLGPLRYVVVDNRFHRIHHSVEARHHDKNFGITFSLWDQLFRTAYFPSKDEWPDVGVADCPPPVSLKEFLCYPLRLLPQTGRMFPNLRERLRPQSQRVGSPADARAETQV